MNLYQAFIKMYGEELKIPTMEDKDELKAVCNAVDRKYLSDRLPRQ